MNKLDAMRHAGKTGQTIFKRIQYLLEPGMTTNDVNDIVVKALEINHCSSAFLNHQVGKEIPFPAHCCVSINEEVCHGIPSNRKIKGGDLVSVDLGIRYQKWLVDACQTFEIGEVSEEASHLNYWTRVALRRALRHIKAGVKWNDIAQLIENTAKYKNLGLLTRLSGHGVGEKLHEAPTLRNYICEANEEIVLQEDQTLSIEPMFALGDGDSEVAEDKWTILTKDRSLSSHWEHCVVITKTGCDILL